MHLGKKNKSSSTILFGDIGALELQHSNCKLCNGMQILFKE